MRMRHSHFLPSVFALVRSIGGECTLTGVLMLHPAAHRSPVLAALWGAGLWVAASAVAGCSSFNYTVTPIRSGALYTSKGDRCGIRFDNLTFLEGSAKYENLGMVTLSGGRSDEFSDSMKADIEKAACHMGGDAVSLNASGPGFYQFIVWRAR